jgi:glucosamine--fructose-6-phosphate aminotransferase (isomerizing)
MFDTEKVSAWLKLAFDDSPVHGEFRISSRNNSDLGRTFREVSSDAIFESETDTEVMVHLVDQALQASPPGSLEDLPGILFPLFKSLEGSFACAFLFEKLPGVIVCYRQGTSPLVVGYGQGETFFGSDALSLAGLSPELAYLNDGDLAVLTPGAAYFWNSLEQPVDPIRTPNPIASTPVTKEGYPHFMAKEIHQQPLVLEGLLAYALPSFEPPSGRTGSSAFAVPCPQSLRLVGCGTAYYAGLVACSWFEQYAGLSPHVDTASEFRYRRPPLSPGGMLLLISQSGETTDTLGALAYGQEKQQEIVGVVNVPGSSLARTAQRVLYTLGGPEIGVASTKGFTSQLMVLSLLSLSFGHQAGLLPDASLAQHLKTLGTVGGLIRHVLETDSAIRQAAATLTKAQSALFLGRGAMAALASEGALKLKELSYIHAEGYPAGEMKHGPIALLDEALPVIALTPWDPLLEKMASNLQESAARGAPLLVLTDAAGKKRLEGLSAQFVVLPETCALTAPFIYGVALQLLAYHVACLKGHDVDRPRNLAKSVTVE